MTNYLQYLPPFYSGIKDFVEIGKVVDDNIVDAAVDYVSVLNEMFVSTCSEDMLTQWEHILGISVAERTTLQRRMMISAAMQGDGKLTESKIQTIVATFTGGTAYVSFDGSALDVKVAPPAWGEVFLFPDVERVLKPMVPAHITLVVERFYNTWNDRKSQYATWQAMKDENDTWATVKNRIGVS